MPYVSAEPGALSERRGNVLLITINRPDARNAVNQAVSIGVGDALQAAQDDPEIRAVVITGSGDKSFCAGADLKALSRGENLFHPDHTDWGFAGYVSHFIDKPTIAAVNGTALSTVGSSFLSGIFDLKVVDGAVNLIATIYDVASRAFRRLQVGFTQGYAMVMVFGAAILLGIFYVIRMN